LIPFLLKKKKKKSLKLGIKGRSWEELEDLGGTEIVEEAKIFLSYFGYSNNEPVPIKVYEFQCEDQAHYLVNFLSTLPYSRERPLRFLYDVRPSISEVITNLMISFLKKIFII